MFQGRRSEAHPREEVHLAVRKVKKKKKKNKCRKFLSKIADSRFKKIANP